MTRSFIEKILVLTISFIIFIILFYEVCSVVPEYYDDQMKYWNRTIIKELK